MKSQYVDELVRFSPKKGLLTIKLPMKVVADAFRKLEKKGIVTRVTYQDGSGTTSVKFLQDSHKKVGKIAKKLAEEHLEKKGKDKKHDKKK